ncbi:symmetrical bis(5'-nucleosyl)-tetraphosphatase [Gayadomonas joobiniege]|uniref:symmetrical bis(5'-nucleosyl)-tetraphosphatase n=1 Tax=Gayadomonas joobiniege TaxID=1234606 RepID=UPI00036BED65|nr:symmetrical bis(5'-nucleosyl)-tetraphosphatase [Gayadomonas joobiniege]
MAHYFVGDIQGCYDELNRLLEQVRFDPAKDILCPVGDLIARGPASEKVADLMLQLKSSVLPVLGNHDIHFLSVCHGLFKLKKKDGLAKLFDSAWRDEYTRWLVQQPLIRYFPQFDLYMSHAGLHPQVAYTQQIELAEEAMQNLRGKQQKEWLSRMYGAKTGSYNEQLGRAERFRFIINVTTRMRYLHEDGSLEFAHKDAPDNTPNLVPWFDYPQKHNNNSRIVFGHWASLLGHTQRDDRLALDTGCVWGNKLTAYCPEHNRYYFQASASG